MRLLFTLIGIGVLLFPRHACASLCTSIPSQNISQPDLVAPKFSVSAADCCNACSDMSGCVAAVYSSYYCHLKGSLDGITESAGSEVLIAAQPTPPPFNTSTTTTTAAPPTTTTPVPQPTEAPTWTIVREIYCQYSGHCNMSNDNTCSSKAYFNNTCHKKHKRVCGTYHITVDDYADDGCGGVIRSHTEEDINACNYIDENGNYGHYCDVQRVPETGVDVYRSDCNYGCDGSDCNVNKLKTGVCQSNPFSWLSGSSVIAWCFPQYILWLGYGSIDCSGPVAEGVPQPHGCYESGYSFIHNICGGGQ